jgi:hypothetical protein
MTRATHFEHPRARTEGLQVRSERQTNGANATTDAAADDELVPRLTRDGHRRAASTTTVGAGQCLLPTGPEAADRLGIGRSLLYELLADGQVESSMSAGSGIPADALGNYIDRQRVAGRTFGTELAPVRGVESAPRRQVGSTAIPRHPVSSAAVVCPHFAHMKIKGPVRIVRTEPVTCTFLVAGAGFEPATSGL